MKISVKAKEFFATVHNDKNEVIASVQYDSYDASIDLLGIIDAAGNIGEALRALQQRALEGNNE
jgi:hypothetical protein